MIKQGSEVFVATSNSGKVAELQSLLKKYDLRILSALDVDDYVPPVEDGEDFSSNALIKASVAAKKYNMPAIADDSGLCCQALNGDPGVQTARFGGDISYDEKAKLLWEKLKDKDKSAYFACAIAVVLPSGQEEVFYGEVRGQITYPAESTGGWGYDPYFIPENYEVSFASLSPQEKNRISHRGIALQKMLVTLFEEK